MQNIVFDLGGVVFARDARKWTPDFTQFFSFVRDECMPAFWEEYDRGALTLDQVIHELSRLRGTEHATTASYLSDAIARQEEIACTAELIRALKAQGYRLYVLSNMSREFIAFLRRMPVYECFDGEIVSCEEGVVKPDPAIYRLLLQRFGLDPAETLFIDDRPANLDAAGALGIGTFLFDHRDPARSCEELRAMLL